MSLTAPTNSMPPEFQRAMSHSVDIFDGTDRHQQTVFKIAEERGMSTAFHHFIKVASCLRSPVETLLHEISVVGMSSSQHHLNVGFAARSYSKIL